MNFDPFWPLSGKSLTVIGISHCSRCLGAWLSTRHWRAPEDITMWALFSTAKCSAFWSILQGYIVGHSRVILFVCYCDIHVWKNPKQHVYLKFFMNIYDYMYKFLNNCVNYNFSSIKLKHTLVYMFMYKESHVKKNKITVNKTSEKQVWQFRSNYIIIEKKFFFTYFNTCTNLMIPGIWFAISIFRHWVLLIDSWRIQW